VLTELTIRDLAIIPEMELRFGPGLNVLSGETGAGKSLVVGGLRLLCGERPPPEFVREGEERGSVEAVFTLEPGGWIAERLAGLGLDVEDGELILRREIAAEGKGRVRANGRAVPLRVLVEASELLVDLHGQHDHQALLRPSWQREAVDERGEAGTLRRRFAAELDALRAVRAEREELASAVREGAERAQLHRFQREELDRAAPERGELAALLAERGRLAEAARLREAAARVVDGVAEAEDSVRDVAARLARVAGDAAAHDEAWAPISDALDALAVAADEIARDARRRLDGTVDDPERLAWVRERVRALEDLLHKYGPEEDDLFARWDRLRGDESDPHARERRLAALREREAGISDRIARLGGELTQRRAEAGRRLARTVAASLGRLGMPGARFEILWSRRDTGVEVRDDLPPAGPSGFDVCEFLLAANRGARPLPLRAVASGGELSRVMLALKCALGETRGTATMVFDEIDHGIGGVVAARVAESLAELGAGRQVLCITHLPQIASRAATHFRVVKEDGDGAARTRVERVEGESRVREIARMLGEESGEGSAVRHARDLLARERA